MAGTKIRGITIELNADASGIQKAINGLDKSLKTTQSNLKDINKLLKFDPKNTELLTQKQKNLETAISDTEKRITELKKAQDGVKEGTQEWDALEREIIANEQELKKLNEEYKRFGSVALQQVKAVGQELKNVGDKMTEVGKGMTKYVTAPIVAGMTVAVKTTADFDTAMSQVAATMGTTVDKVVDLRDYAREMGAQTAFSASEAAEAMNYMALAGYDTEKIMKVLPTVLNLAAAGNIDLASASDMVTDAQSALGLSLTETTTMVDQMAAASSKSNTSVAQLGEAFLTIGATARNLQGGTRELATILGVLADNGIKGAEGGTHLRNILLSLQKEATDGAIKIGDMSVAVYDADGNFRSMESIIGDMQKSLAGMTQESRDAAISGVFNKTDLAAVNALLGTTSERFNELGSSISGSSGAAQQMADTQLDNLNGQLTLLKSATDELAISFGDVLVPKVQKVVEWVQKLVDKFNSLSPETKETITTIGLVVAAIGPLLLVGGGLISGIGKLLIYAPMVVTAISSVAAPVAIVSGVIVALIAIGVLLYKNWDKIKETAIKVKDGVVSAWNGLKEKVGAVIDNIKGKIDTLKTKFDEIRQKASDVVQKIKDFFNFKIELPKIKLPHLQITYSPASSSVARFFGISNIPHLSIQWYKKAYDNPVMFTSPTVVNTPNGAKGFGDGHGAEIVMSLNKLQQLVGASRDIVVNVYGAQGQNVNELADAIQARLVALQKQREVAVGA